MRWTGIFVGGTAAIVVAVVVATRVRAPHEAGPPRRVVAPENTPVCPWREPETDLAALFPTATGHVLDTRILSGLMVEAQKRLGRRLSPDENPLRVFRVHNNTQKLGCIIVHRVKGEHGGIELVTGFTQQGRVKGVLIQSQREPAPIASTITNAAWLAQFRDKTSSSEFNVDAPPDARFSADAIAQGVRSAAILLQLTELPLETRGPGAHTNR